MGLLTLCEKIATGSLPCAKAAAVTSLICGLTMHSLKWRKDTERKHSLAASIDNIVALFREEH